MNVFKKFLPNGQESKTDEFWVDLAGKPWPIYVKRLLIPALANAGNINIAHLVPTIKLNGHFHVRTLTVSNAAGTARVNLYDTRITSVTLVDVTNINIVNTTDLTLYNTEGSIVIEYCKTTD